MRKLSTHVLDTAHGCPAAGVGYRLSRLSVAGNPAPHRRVELATGLTNADGRTDTPLLIGEALLPGVYELEFAAGDYFRALGIALADPPFVDVVLLRFGIAAGDSGYHVPLLVSPWSWSSYRGS
jgi:5-hydroxyisourate hydrolase